MRNVAARSARGAIRRALHELAGVACVLLIAGSPDQALAHSGLPGANGKIAFSSARDGNLEIYAMNADGSGQTRLTNNAAEDNVPAWSPDGTKIAFSSIRDGNWNVYVMNANGSGQTRLTTNAALDAMPAWSPDGTKIAFPSTRDGNFEIYVMNADGSGQRRVAYNAGQDTFPAWSPDGRRIAFDSNRGGNLDIYTMNANGSGEARLTSGLASDGNPTWSPDGTRIAFHSDRDGDWEIFSMNADGGGQTNLTNNTISDGVPVWSPDGTKIAFDTHRGLNDEVYSMNADGSGQTDLSHNDVANDGVPGWQPIPNDLAVQATATPAAIVGGAATYAFTATNQSAAPAPGAELSVSLPEHIDTVSASPTQGSCAVQAAASCSFGSLAGGASATVMVTGRATQQGAAAARGTASIWGADANPANNYAEAAVSVIGMPAAATPVSLRITYPRGMRTGEAKRIDRRALYRALVKGFRGEVAGDTRLEGSVARERGGRCRHAATGKQVSCSRTSSRGMTLDGAGVASTSTFTYKPFGSRSRARKALANGKRIEKGAYQLAIRAFPGDGEPQLLRFSIRAT